VWSWGSGYRGEIGVAGSRDKISTDYPVPVKADKIANAQQVATSGSTIFVVGRDGKVWSWGNNQNGGLADPNYKSSVSYKDSRDTPEIISGLSEVAWVAGGGNAAFALKSDGTAWAWGRVVTSTNSVGTAFTEERKTPFQVNLAR
jgi:alpha-tubulin suppressor-like RCC1 family protein